MATLAKTRKFFLISSLFANLSILCFFKYSNFFIENVNSVASILHWNYSIKTLKILLPIGLSFHTFQSMAYVFEVYKKRFVAERNLLRYSVYVLYFPQLVAGPIERPQNILPQLRVLQKFEYERTVLGLYLILQGLFKKAVVADTLAPLVGSIFDRPENFGSLGTLVGILAFSIQIYCDFSGYSDIARGTSRILGIELMLNFNKPYFARSITEFWRRWHISLSTWFRDYVYIPLGGNRGASSRTCLNLLLVFVLSGFWHGANWTFIIWGFLHGLFLILENFILKPLGLDRLPIWLGRVYVFVLVAVTWVFFRAENLSSALQTFRGLIRPSWLGINSISNFHLYESMVFIGGLVILENLDEHWPFWQNLRKQKMWIRWSFYWMTVLTFLFIAQFSKTQFIYFQF